MALNAKKIEGKGTGPKQEPIEPGTYPARVVQILDMGLQPQKPYQGQEKPPVQMINLTYELVDEFCVDEDGKEMEDKPRWISEIMPFHSLKADKAKSTKRYLALDPDEALDGDFTQLINMPCQVTVVNNSSGGKVYNNVQNIAAMRSRDADKCPELVNPSKLFILDEPDLTILGSLPDWIQDKIKSNLEFKGSKLESMLNGKVADNNDEKDGDEDGDW